MRVVFRADASVRIGTGHVVRCRTLAQTLRARGAQISFVCRDHSGNMINALASETIQVTRLPAPPTSADAREDYSQWLGVTQAEDAAQTVAALGGERPDWLVVDHYGLDAEWESALRPHVGRLLVIDDLAKRRHDCDLLLDQNFSFRGDDRYKDLVPATCRLLTGPRYALLRPEYAAYRKCLRRRDGCVTRVLLFMGGGDPDNLTGIALKALSEPELEDLQVDVVIGPSNPHAGEIASLAKARRNTFVHGPRQHLADLMVSADLAIGAGGATTWERMCVGLPSLVISLAENQRSTCEALGDLGLVDYVGHFTKTDAVDLRARLAGLVRKASTLRSLEEKGLSLVDGKGSLRLAEVLTPTPLGELTFQFIRERDGEQRTNSKRVVRRAGSTVASHGGKALLRAGTVEQLRLNVDARGLSLGEITLACSSEDAAIDIQLHSTFVSRQLSRLALRFAAQAVRSLQPRDVDNRVDARIRVSPIRFLRSSNVDVSGDRKKQSDWSIAILSDDSSWLNERIPDLIQRWLSQGYRILWAHELGELRPGDFCFYLSCGRIVPKEVRSQFKHNLVVHESDLPKGKGWSPLTWQVLEGNSRIPVTMFEAADRVDSGAIYAQEWVHLEGHELIQEMRARQAEATFRLCERFVSEYPGILTQARSQAGEESFFPRRHPSDSRLNPTLSIGEQFLLLRVVDNERYPAYFEHVGQIYELAVMKRRL